MRRSHSRKMIGMMKEYFGALENSLQSHINSLKQPSTEHVQALAMEQAKLSKVMVSNHKQLAKEHDKQKLTYSDIVKSKCHEVITTLESKLDKLTVNPVSSCTDTSGATNQVDAQWTGRGVSATLWYITSGKTRGLHMMTEWLLTDPDWQPYSKKR